MHARYNKTNNTDMLMSVSQSQFYPRGIHFISCDQGSNPGLHSESAESLTIRPLGNSLTHYFLTLLQFKSNTQSVKLYSNFEC